MSRRPGTKAPTTGPSGTSAAEDGFVIVMSYNDFYQRALLLGPPPKVIWLRLGNCSTEDVERVLRAHAADIVAFEQDHDAALLILG